MCFLITLLSREAMSVFFVLLFCMEYNTDFTFVFDVGTQKRELDFEMG
jgi:hypothetical protein